jgi:signal transduction histidine kinase
MHERVEAVGGSVTFGDHPDGGFEVVAELPTRAPAP